MKLLLADAGHCLSLALAREASRRRDTQLIIVEETQVTAEALVEARPDALVMPPLSAPSRLAPAEVMAHVEAVDANLELCREYDVPLIWCVSDELYEDGGDELLDEHVIPSPRDDSLKRLIATGDRVRECLPKHLIVRLGPLFALDGAHAWLPELLATLLAGDEVRAAQDVILCPTSVDAVAMALIGMVQQQGCGADAWGAYHLAGTEPISPYTFASVVRTYLATHLERQKRDATLGTLHALHHHHDHPLRRVLKCRRVLDVFGVHQKPWRLELSRMLDDWCLLHDKESAT
ncbi:sugar nucleotide-binding protein [Chromohalobacter nigrandesensis]|uniref:sugar nucleotide-binding protein n=1 Tax=Chromohalobacter nigrandesensis TaxID=119863 RepID=UPI001FF6A8DA|nr:sugar nucleotide-binding protein [Chromohalobacter nigrandesensis]